MPSISKAKLDELNTELEARGRLASQHHERAETAERKLRQFDSVLDKIVRAAEGRPLTDERNAGGNYWGASNYIHPSADGVGRKPKAVELQAQEIRSLNDRIVHLESRLAATVAVATFAKAHKA